MKTIKQNNTFHDLLNEFWISGCSSFFDADDMRLYYKRIAGLVKLKDTIILKKETKKMLWKCIKILPLEKEEYNKLLLLLKGKIETEMSWSIVNKENAKFTINTLINDMITAGVNTLRFQMLMNEFSKGLLNEN